MNNVEFIIEQSRNYVKESKLVFASMDEIEEWKSLKSITTNIKSFTIFVAKTISIVEIICEESKETLNDLKSEEKLEAAVKIVDDFIKLNVWLEWLDDIIIRIVISNTVEILNMIFEGKKLDAETAKDILKNNILRSLT